MYSALGISGGYSKLYTGDGIVFIHVMFVINVYVA